MRVFLIGYPGKMGGANTEALHTVKLWRRFGVDVHLVPTWGRNPAMKKQLDAIGCTTHHVPSNELERVPGLAGSVAVGFCNSHFMLNAKRLRAIGCKLVWVNCMTFLFGHEVAFFQNHGPADAMVYQSEFQRDKLEPELERFGYDPKTGHLIRGAFDVDALKEKKPEPRPHLANDPFFMGRVARPAKSKWSSNTWKIYRQVNYPKKRAVMLGTDAQTLRKLGPAPIWATCHAPQSLDVADFFARLHLLFPINGGDRENWPRAGLEAMAAAVPIVTQDAWGWREMIDHGRTGFLGATDEELAHWAAVLAWDELLRLKVIKAARDRLIEELADPVTIWAGWRKIFDALSCANGGAAA